MSVGEPKKHTNLDGLPLALWAHTPRAAMREAWNAQVGGGDELTGVLCPIGFKSGAQILQPIQPTHY